MALDLDPVRARFPMREILWFEKVGSTMTEAARLAAAGCRSGLVVGAEQQASGQGRLGRSWHSEKAAGLYFSIVLRLGCEAESLPAVTLALGLAAAEAIQAASGVCCDLRWPNDVLIGGRKCAGILVQLQDGAMIAGIGLNVNHAVFPDELKRIATSLRIATGREHSRQLLLEALLAAIDNYCDLLVTEGRGPILRMFSRTSSYVSGRRVVVDQGDTVLSGTTAGLDPAGFLILRQDDGREHLILAGGVRPVEG